MQNKQNLVIDRVSLEGDLQKFLAAEILKKSPHIPVEKNISVDEFKEKYVAKNKPVILRGIIDQWPAIEKWDFDYFANQHGNVEIDVNLYNPANTKKSNIKSLVNDIKTKAHELPIYLQEWWFQTVCPDLVNDVSIPNHFAEDQNFKIFGYHNFTLWIGAKGASTPVHQDMPYVNIWTSQIRGKKEWILFDKNATLLAGDDGKPDYQEFLSNPNNHVSYCILEKGDVLYVPYKWWHRAVTLEDAISLNTFYINDEIVRRYVTNVLSIPLAVALNKDLLQEHDMRRYNICMTRINMLSNLLGLNKDDILNVKSGVS